MLEHVLVIQRLPAEQGAHTADAMAGARAGSLTVRRLGQTDGIQTDPPVGAALPDLPHPINSRPARALGAVPEDQAADILYRY